MSANDVPMNEANDGAIHLGGDGSAFVPIAEHTDNVPDEVIRLASNLAPIPEVDNMTASSVTPTPSWMTTF